MLNYKITLLFNKLHYEIELTFKGLRFWVLLSKHKKSAHRALFSTFRRDNYTPSDISVLLTCNPDALQADSLILNVSLEF